MQMEPSTWDPNGHYGQIEQNQDFCEYEPTVTNDFSSNLHFFFISSATSLFSLQEDDNLLLIVQTFLPL